MAAGNRDLDRHASLMEVCPDWVLTVDASSRVTGMNPAAEEALGVSAGAARGLTIRRFVLLPWPPPHERIQTRAIAAGGIACDVEAVVRPLPSHPGEFACFVRESFHEGREHAQGLAALLESSDDGMVAVRPDGTVSGFNRRLLAMWDLPEGATVDGADALFRRIARQVRDPGHALLSPATLLTDPRAEVSDLMELTDGRVFQISCRWDRSARRVWWFRDATPWSMAEAELTERNRRIALGNDVGAAVVAEGTLRDALQSCAEAMVRHLDGAFARVWLLDEAEGVLTLEASAGLHTGTGGRYARIPVGHAKIGRIAHTREPHLTNDLLNDPALSDPEWARRTGITAFAGYPLMFEDRVVGVMAMFAVRPLSPTVLDALRGCAERLAIAVARARSEAEVRESERRFRLLSEAALEGIVVHSQGVLVDANTSFARLLGYDPAEIPGRRVGEFLQLPDGMDADGLAPGWLDQPRELLGLHLDGTTVPLEVSTRSIRRAGRELWVLVVRDLTERRHLEEQTLQLAGERAARTRAAFLAQASHVLSSSLEAGAVYTATAHLAVHTLGTFAAVFSLDDGRVTGSFAAHAEPEHGHDLEAAVAGLVRWAESEEWVLPRSAHAGAACDGLLAELRSRLAPELQAASLACLPLTAAGTTVGLLALGAEPGRELDPAALGLAEELAYRAGSALENARLFAAALQATRARDDLLSIVAHDLRNPLNLISSAAELVSDGVLAGDRAAERRHLQIIRRAAGQMNRLIADLLDANRMESGSLSVDMRPESVEQLVAEALTLMCPLAESSGLRLDGAADSDLPPVWADPGRVQQVLSNLIGNAIKFTPRGGTVRVTAQRCGDELRFGVSDSGSGIAPEQLPHIFTRFWQADARDRRGIGLGLSIARAIVGAHAGRIWVESEPGAGATFYFTLPLAFGHHG